MGKIILVLIFLFLALRPGFSQTVILKNGSRVEGRIIEQNEKSVKLDIEGAEVVYFDEEILSIEQENSVTPKISPNPKSGINTSLVYPVQETDDYAGFNNILNYLNLPQDYQNEVKKAMGSFEDIKNAQGNVSKPAKTSQPKIINIKDQGE